jgi:hypothetical protein
MTLNHSLAPLLSSGADLRAMHTLRSAGLRAVTGVVPEKSLRNSFSLMLETVLVIRPSDISWHAPSYRKNTQESRSRAVRERIYS